MSETATQARDRIEEAARKRYRNDARFHAIVQTVVADVLRKHGRVDPDHADQEAADIATRVAALVIETMFSEDQELQAQRAIAERYKKIAEDSLAVRMPPMFFGKPAALSPKGEGE